MHLNELIVQRRVCYGSQMKNRVELLVPKLGIPIEGRQVLHDKIAAITGEILEVA